MKVKAKSFEAWKVIMITLVFLSYCVGMMPGEKAQAVYDKYLDNGIFGMAFFFVLVGFGIGIHYHKKFINLNKKNYLEFLGKKLGILYPLYMIMQTVFLILAYHQYTDASGNDTEGWILYGTESGQLVCISNLSDLSSGSGDRYAGGKNEAGSEKKRIGDSRADRCIYNCCRTTC